VEIRQTESRLQKKPNCDSPAPVLAVFHTNDGTEEAFVGGSLVPRGGHNIIEPARYGVATVVGNHTENFRDIVGLFQSRDAVRIVGPAELPLVLIELLANDVERRALGQRAAETMRSQVGATMRTVDELLELMARP